MFRFGHGRWSLQLADGWEGEVEDGAACITRPDGDGALLVSAADKRDGPIARADLAALARGECPADANLGDCEFGQFQGVHAMYLADGLRWHRWYLGHGSLLLFVSYMVPVEAEGDDDDALIGMLRTLEGIGERWR